MIVVDSSVWIAHLRDLSTPTVIELRRLGALAVLVVGDVILLEVLRGARSEIEAAAIERDMRRFEVVAMVSPALAVQAAHNYRVLRGKGITIRKTADLIIGTYCIAHHHTLLHDDRDFEPMQVHLGLKVL